MVHKKTIAFLMVFIVLASQSIIAFSNDIPDDFWAKSSIDQMKALGIMNAYADGSFKPNEATTNVEAIIVIYRAAVSAGLVDAKANALATDKYSLQLEAMGMPKILAPYGSDVYPALAYALEQGIVEMDEVKTFLLNGQLTQARKVNVAVFFAKALNAYKNENLNKIIILTYKDESQITLSARKYIYFLIEHGILSSKGDTEGNFGPNLIISRAIMATMAENLLTHFKQVDPAVTPPVVEDVVKEEPASTLPPISAERILTGTITSIDAAQYTMMISSSDLVYDIYQTEVYYNETRVGLEQLVPGVVVEMNVKNGYVATIHLTELLQIVEGQFDFIGALVGGDTPFRSLRMITADKKFEFRRVDDKTIITIDGKAATIDALTDKHKLYVINDGTNINATAKRIMAYSQSYTVKGELLEKIDTTAPKKVRVLLENGMVNTFDVASDVIFMNGQAGFDVGTLVALELKDHRLTKIEHLGTLSTTEGLITQIIIQKKPELTINGGKSLVLDSRVKIINEAGSSTLNVYDLRLDQEVTLYHGVNGVKRIEFGKREAVEKGIAYTVTQVFGSSNLLLVKDPDLRTITVAISDASVQKASEFKIGDVVYIEGKMLTDVLLEASKITIKSE